MFNLKQRKNILTFGALSYERGVNSYGFANFLKESSPTKADHSESFLIWIELKWEYFAKQTENTRCTFMNMILYYDLYHTCNAHFGIFSDRIPSYGWIWISLRFIHTEIYFSKEAPTFCVLHKRRQRTRTQMWPQGWTRTKSVVRIGHVTPTLCLLSSSYVTWIRIKEQTNSQIQWNIDSKPNQKMEFVYIMAGIVCHINKKATNSSKWTCSVSAHTSWFYLIFILAIFHHTRSCVCLLRVSLAWPFIWHHWMHLAILFRTQFIYGRKHFLAEVKTPPFIDLRLRRWKYILIYYIWIPDGHRNIPNTICADKKTLTVIQSNGPADRHSCFCI